MSHILCSLMPALLAVALTGGAMGNAFAQQLPVTWDLESLCKPPVVYPADLKAEGVQGIFLEGLPYQGKPTRVFAWFGLPDVPAGQKVPAMVLVHGGGGTAFDEWVRLWTARGYAAIAIDWNGQVPPAPTDAQTEPAKGATGRPSRHDQAGPHIDSAMNLDVLADQWQYHAIAAIVRAHSFLAARPEVDADRIGLTGISWGGYLVCIASGVDHRFKLVMPVYGCGFLDEESTWMPALAAMGPDKARQWVSTWDPARYVGFSTAPMLFVSGTNDFAYGLNSLVKTAGLAKVPATLCVRVRMAHGHSPGWAPPELYAFADSILKGQPGLVTLTRPRAKGNRAFVDYRLPAGSDVKVVWAELNYTTDRGKWVDRRWQIDPAHLPADRPQVKATLPEGTVSWYLNVIDSRGLVVSSVPQTVDQPAATQPAQSQPGQ